MRKTNPIGEELEVSALKCDVQNEANSADLGRDQGGGLYETNPISPGLGPAAWEATGQVGRGRPTHEESNCARQSPSFDCGLRILDFGFKKPAARCLGQHGPVVQTNPMGPVSPDPGAEMRKTNPIPGGQDTRPFHYSIIPALQSEVDCAKRTQSPPLCRSGDRRSPGESNV